MASQRRKINQPETFRQAQRFDQNRNLFARIGFCDPCAAAAAYGVQLGWSAVAEPCRKCITTVDAVAVDAVGVRWQKIISNERGVEMRTSALSGARALPDAHTATRPAMRPLSRVPA